MSTPVLDPLAGRLPSGEALPRLLAEPTPDSSRPTLGDHVARWGKLDLQPLRDFLIPELERSGLKGHGGAWFPVGAKWRSVSTRGLRAPVVVANGAEGEPGSRKDALLLSRSPHLVLDGLAAAAAALRAHRAIAYVPAPLVPGMERALDERCRFGADPVEVELVAAPSRFIAGQESAVVNAINGGGAASAVPTFVGLRPVRERGVGRRPTLVQNVETLAHVALIARFGSSWFRSLGSGGTPGTMLLTVSGRWASPTVIEAPLGLSLRQVLRIDPGDTGRYAGALLGGYGGAWVPIETLLGLPLSEAHAREAGATLGAGVVMLLPIDHCPIAETARVLRYLDGQGAGQCGPCVHGLSSLAERLEGLAFTRRVNHDSVHLVNELCDLIEGRGACRHPDGAARLVRSALNVFGDEADAHVRHGACRRAREPGYFPV